MYKGCVSHSVVVWYFVRLHVRHVFVLPPLVKPHVRHARLGLHIAVSLKGRTTRIWFFGCAFSCTTSIGCAGFKLILSTIIVL